MRMRALFMGTPDFAATVLEKIIQEGHEIIGVVTQPDKQKGRGHEVSFSQVKELALKHGLTIYQPVKVKDEEFLKTIENQKPEIILVAAFGQILPKKLLDIPQNGCINVHASLLPKYRGAAPIQYSIIDGEKETGVTIMHMDVGLDTGDIIMQKAIAIAKDETGGSLFDKLADLGGELLIEAMRQIEDGTANRIPQEHEKATYVKVIDKQMGRIDFNQPAVKLERLIRGLNPWPSAFTRLDDKNLKLWKTEVESDTSIKEHGVDNPKQDIDRETIGTDKTAVPGEVIQVNNDSISVMTGEGILVIKELQLEGKKRMTADAFLRGYPIPVGTKLG